MVGAGSAVRRRRSLTGLERSSDPAVLPKTHNGRILYGVILGGMNAVLCYFGAQELGFVFAILLANIFVHSCDRYAAFLKASVGRLWQRAVSAVKSRKKGGAANA